MKITNIYKTTAALIFLMVAALWPAAEAWGQEAQEPEYVTGNRYLMIDENSKVSTYGADITAKTSGGTNASGGNGINNAFDGNDNTWWASSRSGTINIDIDFNTYRTIRAFHFLSGGNTQERENELHVYSSTNGSQWTLVESFVGDRTIRQHDYCLKNVINTRYLRLQLVPGRTNYALAINEISLYSRIYSDNRILHKHPKWFELRNGISEVAKNMDTFEDVTKMFTPKDNPFIQYYPVGEIQAAHTYIDTIYMHPGTSVTLTLPDKLNDVSVRGYQRWYSFRTDGTYRTNNTGSDEVWDLLTPTVGTSYRFANGYVSKPIDTNANGTYQMNFYFPKEGEFNSWFPDHGTLEGNWFVVACDVSGYNDYTETFNTTSSGSNFLETLYEPTLTHRVLYYIASVDNRTGDNRTGDNWTNGHGRLSQNAYQGGGNTDGKKYLEEYEISFPYTRLSNTVVPTTGSKTTASPEQVALSKDARAYAIPKELLNGVSDTDELTVTLIDGNGNGDEEKSGIELIEASTYRVGGNSYRNYTNVQSLTISGENRVIQFAYPTTKSNGTQSVLNNNSTATILVTKTVGGTKYNIARFKLNFVADTRLLTQTQLQQIENGTIKDEER